ncbi:Uricase-2 [Nymphaea thermarum]|nr:Uricase-2 [Nymphaea thermarum]
MDPDRGSEPFEGRNLSNGKVDICFLEYPGCSGPYTETAEHSCEMAEKFRSEEGFHLEQRHGKARVRVARVWRGRDGLQSMAEWNVHVLLLSDCKESYFQDDNSNIVATDSMKNTVYVKAKECAEIASVEEFAIRLGEHFTSTYSHVTCAIIKIIEKPWERITVDGQMHKHGFKLGSDKHTTEVVVKKDGYQVTSGIEGLALLKTTKACISQPPSILSFMQAEMPFLLEQKLLHIECLKLIKLRMSAFLFFTMQSTSGFEGFIHDKYTLLKETRERLFATEVNAEWRYSVKPTCFRQSYLDIKSILIDTFFGPSTEGVYSPSVQNTLYCMARAVLNRFPLVESVHLKMPNLHFLPVNLANMVQFADDVYTPTDEPHGTIEATLSRRQVPVLSKI